MIDVNIWLSTTVLFKKRITNGIFGPLFASESSGENVGHANLTLDVNESSEHYHYIEAHFGTLNPKKTLSIIPTPVTAKENWSHLAPKTVKSYQFTHSKWPKSIPSFGSIFIKDTKRRMHLSSGTVGIEADFNTHDSDMMREDEGKTSHVVKHKKPSKEMIQSEKSTNLELLTNVSTLEVNFENLTKWQNKLEQLQIERARLTGHLEHITTSHKNEINALKSSIHTNSSCLDQISKKLTALGRTHSYLNIVQNRDPDTQKQFLSIRAQIESLQQEKEHLVHDNQESLRAIDELELIFAEQINTINEDIKSNENAIHYYADRIEQVQQEINGRTLEDLELMRAESRKRVDYTSRKEQFLLTHEKTEGRHPDHIIKLPIKSDGWEYYVDEIKMLEAMQKERQNSTYSFIFNNCATSVKRCILAGIDDTLRDHLIEAGLKQSFFKLNTIETCKGLRTWVRALEACLIRLNFPPLEQEHSKPVNHRALGA
ncbi:hypothetical protein [Legionella bononiensis]|uniref:Uncharacterized protein n=1 Tax=Legionella bononiensis TaxID=2793102 RepID=A0ABS1WA46_9GAMM|nr:hypothetical protein [Legionella bononiensis]MBL7480542.1 hypothetical protein [Legionella bononiensis]MBL7526219.1 hypothetical protein [Legionella bononiensis]MBL7563286.1 hypothetical protein [Legionella bononiensis]